jgi:hypothetical protein
VRLVLLGGVEALAGVGGEHLVGRDVAEAAGVGELALDVRVAAHDAVVVQVAEGDVDEGVVVRAHAQGAVRAVVVGLALALVVVAAEAVAA